MKVIRTILVQLFTGANIATILLLWICCGITYLSPERYPQLSLLGLTFPFLLAINLLFVVFWLIFKIRRVWLPIAGLLACCSFVLDYFPINWITDSTDEPSLSLVSYNSCYYGGKEATMEDGTNMIKEYVKNIDADIICLQESSFPAQQKDLEEEMKGKGYGCSVISQFTLFSRLPILSADTLDMGAQPSHAMKALLLDGKDTVMVLNVHLQSNMLSREMKQAYRDALKKHEKDSVRKELKPILKMLTAAAPLRAEQTDSLTDFIDSWLPRPIIVCGDINDTPISYPYQVLARRLKSAYRQSGNGVGFTFHEKGFPVRIDHIFFNSDYWTSSKTYVDHSNTWSDHFPIVTKLVKKAP